MSRCAILLPILIAGCRCAPSSVSVEPQPPTRPQPLTGAVSGTVRLKGEWWPERTTRPPPAINGIPIDASKLETLVIGDGGSMANVYVAVKSGLGDRKFIAPAQPVVLDQTGFLYSPRILCVMTNQSIKVRNLDPVMHNVHIEMGYAAPQFKQGDEQTLSISRPQVGKILKCDVHPWMIGWVHVSDHPFFALTGVDGNFVISELPPGDYELLAWHERFQGAPLGAKVKVEAGKTATLDFTFAAPLKADR